MENLLKQMREKFTGAEQENRADDQDIPTRKTQSFKDKKKAENWFQRQFLRKMSRDYDSLEIEYATAIAAAAFAISSQDSVQKINGGPDQTSLTKTKSKVGGIISLGSQPGSLSKRFSGSFGSSDGQVRKPERTLTPVSSTKKTSTSTEPEAPPPRKTPSFRDVKLKGRDDTQKIGPPVHSASKIIPPPPPPPPPQTRSTLIEPGPVRPPTPPIESKRRTPSRLHTNERKADAWEREELEKIKLRYDKLKETIDSWETKKKARGRRKLEKKERSDSERKRARAYAKFQGEMEYINGIAGAARAQAEERRRNEELKVKEKTNIIRTTGKLPGTCPCF